MTNPASNSLPRVLIVDNDKRAVALYRQLLSLWEYQPVMAEGAGRRLLEDAKKKAREFRCQIALVDLRLKDDQDEDDVSGLDLIAEIKPAETILVSGHGTMKLVEESFQNRGAFSFFEKDDDPENLKKKIDRLAGRICFARRTLRIEPPELLDLIARTLFDPIKDMPVEARDQAADVLARLFPDAAVLRLEKTSSTVV
ncbi:MAG: response regulator, partial [Chloroflexi bacterium]|nr:response regulator [Chloroflexota bacterium]